MALALEILVFVLLCGVVATVVWLHLKQAAAADAMTGLETQMSSTRQVVGNVGAALQTTGARVDNVHTELTAQVDDLDARALGVAQASSVGVAQVPAQVDVKVAALQSDVATMLAATEDVHTANATALDTKMNTRATALDHKISTQASALERKIATQTAALNRRLAAQAAELDRKMKMQAADTDRHGATQVTTASVRIADNWMLLPGNSKDLYLTDDRRGGLGSLVVEETKAGAVSANKLQVKGLASFKGGRSKRRNPKGLPSALPDGDGKNRIRGDTELHGDVSVLGRLKLGDDSMYIQNVGAKNDSAVVLRNGRDEKHRFDARGDALHKGTVRAGKIPTDKRPAGWEAGVHAKAVYADSVSVGRNGNVTSSMGPDGVAASKIRLADNWTLIGAGSDKFVKVMDKDGKDYAGGMAMNTLQVNKDATLTGNTVMGGNLLAKGDIRTNGKICVSDVCMSVAQFAKLAAM